MKIGDTWAAVVCEELTRTRIVQFAGASGEYSELHVDEPAARAQGHPSVMAHGMLCAAWAIRAITDRVGRPPRDVDTRYLAPAWPGDRLTAECTLASVAQGEMTVDVRLTSQVGTVVLTASARISLE